MISMDTLVLYFGIVILINLILLTYILKLERKNCDCSERWMRDYIKYYSATLIILALILLVLPVLVKRKIKINMVLFGLIRSVIIIATLIQVYSVFKYSQELQCKLKSCKCSDDWRAGFMYWLGIFGFVIYTLLLLAFLMCILTKGPVYCLFDY